MDNNSYPLKLRYLVKLHEKALPSLLSKDISAGFVHLGNLKDWLSRHDMGETGNITYSYSSEIGTYVLDFTLDGRWIEIDVGGLSRIATIIFGNQFRNELIEWVHLYDIDFSPKVISLFKGPNFGKSGVDEFLLNDRTKPILSFPIPVRLDLAEKKKLLAILVSSGISIITESPLWNTKLEDLINLTEYLEYLCANFNTKLIYFLNGTLHLIELQKYMKALKKINPNRTLIGFRLCPFSMGLNTCLWLRDYGFPIYGYNLLSIGSTQQPRYEISPGALASLFRLSGCDIINIGLKYQSIKTMALAQEFVKKCDQRYDHKIFETLPMFTGGITPRLCHEIVYKFGLSAGLHIKKPILRSGLDDPQKINRNILAYFEASQIAINRIDLDEAIGRELSDTKNIRSYEHEYGR